MWIITYRKNLVERYSDLKTEICGSYCTVRVAMMTGVTVFKSIFLYIK
jgi:hypothetical protein